MPNFNIKRLSEDIRREVSASVSGVKDPRVSKGFVTVTRCELSSDLSYCKIWVACMGGTERTATAVEGMKAASGYFKRQIAGAVKMRKIPELVFLSDNTLEYAEHIEDIIAHLPKPAAPEEDTEQERDTDDEQTEEENDES